MLQKSEVKLTAQAEVAARVLSAGVGAPQIITGNYSALMACVNNILTDTVTIAPDGSHPGSSPIFLIAEPMWLDSVHTDYNNELWGQSIDAFPPAIQKFAKENVRPAPEIGQKLTWGQIRDLRSAMLDRIKSTEGFHVYEGQIHKVEEEGTELKIQLVGNEGGTEFKIPFTQDPVVLDFSQRPRSAGPALTGDPTILYQRSRGENESLSQVPIFAAGAGAQTAWVLDKMGDKRDYTILYGTSLDFRIVNAILDKKKYTATDANIKIEKDAELQQALRAFSDEKPRAVTYTRDDGNRVNINLSVYPYKEKGLIRADSIPHVPEIALGYLMGFGFNEEGVAGALAQINEQLHAHEGAGLSKKQLAIKLMIEPPPGASVGFAVNATGWVSLKDTVSNDATPFWGASANVTTGEELLKKAALVTPGSLLPGSGIPRMFAMKNKLREMRATAGVDIAYDVRALAFTGSGFQKMCDDCQFPEEFRDVLKIEVQKLSTPQEAGPDPIDWIINNYGTWLNAQPSIAHSRVEDAKAPEALIERARSQLMKNEAQNVQAESLFKAGSDVIVTDPILQPPIVSVQKQKQMKDEINGLRPAERVSHDLPIVHKDERLRERREITFSK